MVEDELVGVTDIAALLGISRQRVDQLARDALVGFPEPVQVNTTGLVKSRKWSLKEVTRWAKQTGRL